MKGLIRFLMFLGGIVIVAKAIQLAIDSLYDNYGKDYIIVDED